MVKEKNQRVGTFTEFGIYIRSRCNDHDTFLKVMLKTNHPTKLLWVRLVDEK